MADTFTKAERSRIMAAVRSTGNRSTETRLASLFRAAGVTGWRRAAMAAGQPDFVFRRLRVAVFVDGCFWHGCRLHLRRPRQNARYWRRKINCNVARDRLVNRTLRKQGWRVVRIWEHELKGDGIGAIRKIQRALKAGRKWNRGFRSARQARRVIHEIHRGWHPRLYEMAGVAHSTHTRRMVTSSARTMRISHLLRHSIISGGRLLVSPPMCSPHSGHTSA